MYSVIPLTNQSFIGINPPFVFKTIWIGLSFTCSGSMGIHWDLVTQSIFDYYPDFIKFNLNVLDTYWSTILWKIVYFQL